MLQIIHSDEEWVSVIRAILMNHGNDTIEALFCCSVEEWKKHSFEPILFIEDRLAIGIEDYNGRVIYLTDNCDKVSVDCILAYANPYEVVNNIHALMKSEVQFVQSEFNTKMEKSKLMVVAYNDHEIAQRFSECLAEQIEISYGKSAILNLQIDQTHIHNRSSIPITKLILQPDDPIELLESGQHLNQPFQTFHNSLRIDEYLKLNQESVDAIFTKLLSEYNSIICVMDDANLHLQSELASFFD